jgi:hypothetical protein
LFFLFLLTGPEITGGFRPVHLRGYTFLVWPHGSLTPFGERKGDFMKGISYPPETIAKLKRLFPFNHILHEALDQNQPQAWDIVKEELSILAELFHSLSMSGYPKGDF